MNSETDEEDIPCPACRKHGREGAREAMGMILTAAEGLLTGNDEQVMATYEASTPYDFHYAVTMYVEALSMTAQLLGIELEDWLADQRRQLNEAILRDDFGSTTGDPGSSDPS